jgi:hypothetical protein
MDLFGYEPPVKAPRTRGGINGPITEQRAIAAEILEIPVARVGRMTKGWPLEEIMRINDRARAWKINPGALWWKTYKEYKKQRKL